ncbi:MAG: DUF1987 domain-containing protein [Crocinitomix sp.]|nr:DUF1987 domain-containing protein [Crocinitomix sp.]
MQEKLIIKGTRETPNIELNKDTGLFKIEGRSLPENAFEFYRPLVNWMKEYSQEPSPSTHLILSIEYLNSGSLKQIFRIIYMLEDLIEMGSDAKITWKYNIGDELMLEKGKEFKQFLEILIDLEEI